MTTSQFIDFDQLMMLFNQRVVDLYREEKGVDSLLEMSHYKEEADSDDPPADCWGLDLFVVNGKKDLLLQYTIGERPNGLLDLYEKACTTLSFCTGKKWRQYAFLFPPSAIDTTMKIMLLCREDHYLTLEAVKEEMATFWEEYRTKKIQDINDGIAGYWNREQTEPQEDASILPAA